MTKLAIDRAVSAATGERPSTIRRLGFGPEQSPAADPGALAPVIDCPLCGRSAAYPGRGRRGVSSMAECDHCDVNFDFADDELYVADAMAATGEPAA